MTTFDQNCSRRKALKQMAFACTACIWPKTSFAVTPALIKRPIPSSGEKIGIVGLGTWQTFDVGASGEVRKPLKEVLSTLVEYGGSIVDSSPMYGRSEAVVGELGRELRLSDELFHATKVWTTGKTQGEVQMRQSMDKMGARPMDLMQIHNLQDWKTHLYTLYDWKEKGRIRYIGVTHYLDSAHDELERIVKSEAIDFLQVNYSVADRNAERSLLPVAQDNGVAVLVNRPYAGGSLFGKAGDRELPDWFREIECSSWGQFFLKYILGDPAVTAVIPGTSKARHMKDNLKAGMGLLPDQKLRKKMLDHFNSL